MNCVLTESKDKLIHDETPKFGHSSATAVLRDVLKTEFYEE